jgi:hypothetical protein
MDARAIRRHNTGMRAACRALLCIGVLACRARPELHLVLQDGKHGYVDAAGRVVIQPQFVWASEFREGRAVVFVCGMEGYIDATGRMAIPARFLRAHDFREGRALVALGGHRYAFIDRDGRFSTPLYEEASDFMNGLAAVKIGPRWGYIDRDGAVRIPARFEQAYSFVSSARAIAVPGGRRVLIDRTGRVIETHTEKVDEALGDGVFVPEPSPDRVTRVRVSATEWGLAAPDGRILWRAAEWPDHRPLLGWSDARMRESCGTSLKN